MIKESQSLQDRNFYFDVSIWIDIYEKRSENGQLAKALFDRIIKDDALIFYSDLIIAELKHVEYVKAQIDMLLSIAKPDHLRRVHIHKVQIEESRNLAAQRSVPKADALHAVLARDNYAILISTDKDFKKLKDITKTHMPADFI